MTPWRFSRRTAWDTTETEWAALLRELRTAGSPVLDLTSSNPTQCGFSYDAEEILGALNDPEALKYDPNPRGLLSARKAVSAYYADHGAGVDAEQIFLTASTSEAYSFLFRLLCDHGDEVLIAQPSYPLFDFLADLDDVQLVPYPLFYDYGWHLDPEALRSQITSRTRAIVVVHPNNPTGHFTKLGEREVLEQLCTEHGLALIVDEVFLDYPIEDAVRAPSFATGEHPVLTFVLSGLSKIAGLPQMKAAWISCFGPEPALRHGMERLEVIGDTFLSTSAAVQCAIPKWLAGRGKLQGQVQNRVRANLKNMDQLLGQGSLISRLEVEAGWCAPLRIPATVSDETTVLRLLRERGVAIHSGDFFGFGGSGWVVGSLLCDEPVLLLGINELADMLQL
jgi:aspartate/methionine/tyrosine aminotransferase